MPEDHKCEFNFKEKGIKELQKTIVKVEHGKIEQIWFTFLLIYLIHPGTIHHYKTDSIPHLINNNIDSLTSVLCYTTRTHEKEL